MTPYLFRFGFESSIERRTNERQGTDFESSEAILILAETEEAAVHWGRVLARCPRVSVGEHPDYSSWLSALPYTGKAPRPYRPARRRRPRDHSGRCRGGRGRGRGPRLLA